MDRGAWWAVVHGVARSQTWLSNFTFTFHFHALEKEMATHSSVLAWRIPGTGEPGGLPSLGLHRVGHDWSDLAAAAAAAAFPTCWHSMRCFLFPTLLKILARAYSAHKSKGQPFLRDRGSAPIGSPLSLPISASKELWTITKAVIECVKLFRKAYF